MSDLVKSLLHVAALHAGRRVGDIAHEAAYRIEELERLLPADGVHSCGPHCTRLGCVQRRRIEELEAENDRLNRYANALGFCLHEKAGFDAAKAIIELQRKYEALVDGLRDLESHNSMSAEFLAPWYGKRLVCVDDIRALIQSSHPVKNDDI